ncbi:MULTISPECIES: hypothetical protein [Deferrisoma]
MKPLPVSAAASRVSVTKDGLRVPLLARQMLGKIRRFWLVWFRPGYVARKRRERTGRCLRCGRCCSLAVTCPMFAGQGLCLTYGAIRPRVCAAFPIDERDLAEIRASGGACGFAFRPAAHLRAVEGGRDR